MTVQDNFPDPALTGEERIPPEDAQGEYLPEISVDYVAVEQPDDDTADNEAAEAPPVDGQ
jgi:hypothetical protein